MKYTTAFFLLGLAALTACGDDDDGDVSFSAEAIQGTWNVDLEQDGFGGTEDGVTVFTGERGDGGDATITFAEDGTFTSSGSLNVVDYTETDGQVEDDTDPVSEPFDGEGTYVISGPTITLIEDNIPTTYTVESFSTSQLLLEGRSEDPTVEGGSFFERLELSR